MVKRAEIKEGTVYRVRLEKKWFDMRLIKLFRRVAAVRNIRNGLTKRIPITRLHRESTAAEILGIGSVKEA